MSNFKSGSGNLDFGGDDEKEEEPNSSTESTKAKDESHTAESTESETARAASADDQPTKTTSTSRDSKREDQIQTATTTSSGTETYPYFVRRNNVGDERDTRLEIHVRDKVAEQEGKFRNKLAEHLGANEISKTDAREFALLAAFHNPEQVAELMREEGFGTLG
ncbi:acyl-CoA dehydrogenase [Halobellus limi]|uniref:Acyl-CoA dehydrogenase n=1 Tax=Halobellus limi TaxID=699433 RepID=A0A1H6BUX3_9EURY|nr:acyl-CoA dehydrogenase [Halobellus limi]QCC49454.1 acyl-CoA dehydrogenase [Halobellus limi]SEG64463.1 hypothetical protein SAMN04488133_3054 [Halobellus limi]